MKIYRENLKFQLFVKIFFVLPFYLTAKSETLLFSSACERTRNNAIRFLLLT
jgi:hypothetical protein